MPFASFSCFWRRKPDLKTFYIREIKAENKAWKLVQLIAATDYIKMFKSV